MEKLITVKLKMSLRQNKAYVGRILQSTTTKVVYITFNMHESTNSLKNMIWVLHNGLSGWKV